MAVDTARLAPSRTLARPWRHARAISPRAALAGLVVASCALRLQAALGRATPQAFPDEYIYPSLARSIAHGRLAIRGHPAHFPALLESVLTAPFWLGGDVALSYRLTQGFHVVVISLAAVPVYLLARRLGLEPWQQLGCAAVTLALPTLVYSSYLTADALGFTVALSAVLAAVRALERPTPARQGAFLALAGLATLARLQYAVLVVAFLLAAAATSRGRARAALRELAPTLALLSLGGAALLALGLGRALGYYGAVLDLHVRLGAMAQWAATDILLLAFACGYALVPAALTGIVLGLARPADRQQRAFAALVAALAGLLLLEAALYAANGSARFQERYLMVLAPLVPLLFCLGMRRAAERRVAVSIALGGLVLLVVAARVPLTDYSAAGSDQDSPLLAAVERLARTQGVGTAALLVALVAGALALLAAAAPLRPRMGSALVLAGTLLALAGASTAATAIDHQRAAQTRALFLPADPRWVDHSGLRGVAVLVTPSSARPVVSLHLFWNRRLTLLLRLPGTPEVDAFGSTSVRIGPAGALLAAGQPVVAPLLVEEYADTAQLEGARLLERSAGTSLWQPRGTPRLVTLARGRYFDGWLAWPASSVTVWPRGGGPRRGVLCLRLSVPPGASSTVELRAPGFRRTVRLAGDAARTLAIPVAARARWRLELFGTRPLLADGDRLVTAQAAVPRFVTGKASASACR